MPRAPYVPTPPDPTPPILNRPRSFPKSAYAEVVEHPPGKPPKPDRPPKPRAQLLMLREFLARPVAEQQPDHVATERERLFAIAELPLTLAGPPPFQAGVTAAQQAIVAALRAS